MGVGFIYHVQEQKQGGINMNKNQELIILITQAEEEIDKINTEIHDLPKGSLQIEHRSSSTYIFQSFSAKGVRHRRAISSDMHTIKGLCRKKYLELRIGFLNTYLKELRSFQGRLCMPDTDEIISTLPERYLKFPKEYFLEPLSVENNWSNQPFIQSRYREEDKIHHVSNGLAVRSKSEALIAEMLLRYKIEFRYEQTLEINGQTLVPDFTIKTSSGQIIYWEHCGLISDSKYMARHNNKILTYSSAGILPCKNLIITYDDATGKINNHLIKTQIKAFLL